MKILTLISALILSMMFSSSSFASWTKVHVNSLGDTFYIDFTSIKKHNGYVYYREMMEYLEPEPDGAWTWNTYRKVDCEKFSFKELQVTVHKEPMGGGAPEHVRRPTHLKGWLQPATPIGKKILKIVCSR